MEDDPITGRPTRIRGAGLLSAEDYAALQDDHQRRLEALARLCQAAEAVGFGAHQDDIVVLWAEDDLSLLDSAGEPWHELNTALREFRACLPVLSLELFGFPSDTDDPYGEGSRYLQRIGSGVEATAFQSADGSIYKFYLPREGGRIGGSFAFTRGDDHVALKAEANLGSYRDLFYKLELILALDGMPTEVIAVTPEGVVVAKQALGARLAENTDTSQMQPPALIPIPSRFLRVHRDHPRLFFHRQEPWLIADLHAKNLVRAVDGRLRAIDLLAAPFPEALVRTEPLLHDWLERVRHDPHAGSLRPSADDEL